ncbi:sugar phosphate isomerase/epimerase [Candidatus Bathyarchaeota archaeon]|nr:sugar phosphate isomerase/epimerase [Candidatus Bathyarchaeota archaeon]
MGFRYSVFTVMIPEYRVEEVPKVLSRYGYEGVEWRVAERREPAGKPNYWTGNRATLDEENILDEARVAARLCRDVGLEVPALAPYLSPGSGEARIRRVMEAARIMDCGQVRISVPRYDGSVDYRKLFEKTVEDYRLVERVSREMGVKALVEIHMGCICPSASAAYRFVSNFDPDNVGVILDPGNMVVEGFENWNLGVELLGEYLAHVHVKNALWREAGERHGARVWKAEMCPLREGLVSWEEVLKALNKVGYKGWLSFEDFSDQPSDVKLRDNLAFMRSLEAVI